MNNVTFKLNYDFVFSDHTKNIYEIVNFVFLSGVISMFGMIANIINIVMFYKQGFKTTVNISLFALAISDLLALIFTAWFSLLVNPLFIYSEIDIWPEEIMYLTAGAPHMCFSRLTCWITLIITAERCLCIAIPLKIKQIVTPRRITIIIVAFCIFNIITFIPEYSTSYHDWKFIKKRNRTLIGLFRTKDYYKVAGVHFIMFSTLGAISFIGVIVFTSVLVLQLKRKSKWRKTASNNQDQSASNRDTKTMTMVVMIAILLIVTNIPGVIVALITYIEKDLQLLGKYENGLFVLWSFVFVAEAINSSINIFFYYHMSAKFRTTFRLLFCSSEDTTTQKNG